jgi:hypothetical protein
MTTLRPANQCWVLPKILIWDTIVSHRTSCPTISRIMARILARMPKAKVYQFSDNIGPLCAMPMSCVEDESKTVWPLRGSELAHTRR